MGLETQVGWESAITQGAVERAKNATIERVEEGEWELSFGAGGADKITIPYSGIEVSVSLNDLAAMPPGSATKLIENYHDWEQACGLDNLEFYSSSKVLRLSKAGVDLRISVGKGEFHNGGVEQYDGYWFMNSARTLIGAAMLLSGDELAAAAKRGLMVVQKGEDNKAVAALPRGVLRRLVIVPFMEISNRRLVGLFGKEGRFKDFNPVMVVGNPELKT